LVLQVTTGTGTKKMLAIEQRRTLTRLIALYFH
jgi:hypothetical protein